MKEDIIILHVCAKLQVSRLFFVSEIEGHITDFLVVRGQMGVKMGQKWGFRGFLKNQQADLVPYPREGRSYYSTCVCQVTSPGYLTFFLFFLHGVRYR